MGSVFVMECVMTVYDILHALESTSSRNEKIAILQANVDNEVLKQVLVYALDPFKNFYIRKIPQYKIDQPTMLTVESALPKLDKLINREVTGNAAIEYLRLLLTELQPQDAQVIERVVTKDLRCGVSDSTVNKVWKDLIPTYPCMLCSGYEEKLVERMNFPAYVQLKMDGMRFNAIVKDGKVQFRSRNGKELDLLGHLELDFVCLANGANVVFDGELLVKIDGQIAPRQIGNGILSKANKGTLSDKEAALVHATLWDMIPYDHFVSGVSDKIYRDRFGDLQALILPERIGLVEHTVVESIEAAQTIFEQYLAQGQEGIILKNPKGIWEDKRAKHQIKFKGELECDLRIVGWEDGTGKNTGRLGALVLESEDGVVKVNVGTGFTDAARDAIKRDVIGKVCAVKYNARIIDQKSGVHSLFLPVFIEIRDDKNVADASKDIK